MTAAGEARLAPTLGPGLMTMMLGALWALALLRLALDSPALVNGAAALLAIFSVIAAVGASWMTRGLCAVLFSLAVVLAIHRSATPAIWSGLERSVLFAAFLPTLALVRGVAEREPLILGYRARIKAAGDAARPMWTATGAFATASFLSVGASAISAATLPSTATMAERERDARASVCGASQALRWSPFFVALAVVSEFVPDASLPAVVLASLLIGLIGVLAATRILAPGVSVGALYGPLGAVSALVGPAVAIIAVLVLVRELASISTLEAMLLALPVLCFGRALTQGVAAVGATLRAGGKALGHIRGEIAVVTAAMILGTVLSEAGTMQAAASMVNLGAVWPFLLVAGTIVAMAMAAALGLHPLVCGLVAIGALTAAPTGLGATATALTVLSGWSAASMLSMSSLMVLTAATQYGVAPARIAYGRNLLFFVCFLPVEVALIAALNAAI